MVGAASERTRSCHGKTGPAERGEPQDANASGEEASEGEVGGARRRHENAAAGGLERLAAAARASGGSPQRCRLGDGAPCTAAEALVAGFVVRQGASAYSRWRGSAGTGRSTGMALRGGCRGLPAAGGFAAMGHAVTDDWAVGASSSERPGSPSRADRRAGAGRSHPHGRSKACGCPTLDDLRASLCGGQSRRGMAGWCCCRHPATDG